MRTRERKRLQNHPQQVLVGNIGLVYDGPSLDTAEQVYGAYERLSMQGIGRAAGEQVTWMIDGDVYLECDR